MTKRIGLLDPLEPPSEQTREALSQPPQSTNDPDSQFSPSLVEEAILETLEVILTKLEKLDETQEEILDRIEDLQVKLEDIECNIQYASASGSSE